MRLPVVFEVAAGGQGERPLARGEAARMERQAANFYDEAAKRTSDPGTRRLMGAHYRTQPRKVR